MPVKSFNFKITFIFSLAFLAILILFVKPPTDPDLFWHLRQGEEILKTHQIPYEDQFSFTFTGYRGADSWWLSEVLIFYLVSKTGFLIPVLFFAFLGAVTFLAVGFWASLKKVSAGALGGSALFSAIVAWPILGLRPQTISLVTIGLVFIVLHQFWLKKREKLIFLLPLIFVFWANLHAGFTLGLLLIWLFWSLEASRVFLQKHFQTFKLTAPFLTPSQLKVLFGVNLFSTFSTLVNPYGTGLWQTIFNDASSAEIKNQIEEWLAPNFHSELGILFFFYLLVLVTLAYFRNSETSEERKVDRPREFGGGHHLGKSKIHPTRFLILLTFCFLALAAVRHISVFALLSTPFLAEELTALPWRRINFLYKGLVLPLFLTIFILVWSLVYFPLVFRATRSVRNLAEAADYPYGAVEYLKKNPPERIFNIYHWGGYLIWQLPQSKTFIDGRMPGWKRNGREILEDYSKVVDLKGDPAEVINFWRVEVFLIFPKSPLSTYLQIHPDWEKKYEDQTAVIFTQR